MTGESAPTPPLGLSTPKARVVFGEATGERVELLGAGAVLEVAWYEDAE